MSAKNTAKTTDEQYLDLFREFRQLIGTGVRIRDAAIWIDKNDKMPKPVVDSVSIHIRRMKRAIQNKRVKDLVGRKIRPVVAVKIAKMTVGGQQIFDVVYDYLHEMSLDHALSHFEHRDTNISQQRRAATRDLESCLDFNPNVKGHEDKFTFPFMVEEPREVVVENIPESPVQPTTLPVVDAPFASDVADGAATPSGVAKERRGRDEGQPR